MIKPLHAAAPSPDFLAFLRVLESDIVRGLGIPKELLAGPTRTERALRAIMGDEYLEDNEVAPVALAYWKAISEL